MSIRPSLAALPILLTIGCDMQLGERAVSGECPAGETCSSATPGGLTFTRTHATADMPLELVVGTIPRAIALGAKQQLRFAPHGDGALVAVDAKVTSAAFSARLDGAEQVTLEGESLGKAHLRITEAGTELLLDRIELAVRPIAQVWIGPQEPAPKSPTYALLADGSAPLAAAPVSPEGAWLADDGLSILGLPSGTQQTTVRGADGERMWTARSSIGLAGSVALTIASSVDSVGLRAAFEMDKEGVAKLDAPLEVNDAVFVCGTAIAGKVPLLGGNYTFTASPNVTLDRSGFKVGGKLHTACPWLTAKAEGPAWITVQLGGRTFTKNFTIVAAKSSASTAAFRPQTIASPGFAALGERASKAPRVELW